MVSETVANISLILLSVCGTIVCIAVLIVAVAFFIDIWKEWHR